MFLQGTAAGLQALIQVRQPLSNRTLWDDKSILYLLCPI